MKKAQTDRIIKLHKLFLDGKVKGPAQHEVHPSLEKGSRENYLYFTLPCSVNFQRNSPALWKSALLSYEDPETKYLFFPELVVKTDYEKVKIDLRKHKLSMQPNKHCKIWVTLSATLNRYYKSDPREVLKEKNFSVPSIINMLQIEKKSLFPYLGGVKLSNYWLFILAYFTDVDFRHIEEISIIPDTHVIQSSVELGVIKLGTTDTKQIELAWRPILKELSIPPTEMHSALWRWSRESFNPVV
jgi:hypothetical protein